MINFLSGIPTIHSSVSQQAIKKIEIMETLQKIVKQIYQNKTSSNQFNQIIKWLQVQSSYGTLYGIIREKLQNTCKSHRVLIGNSAQFYENGSRFSHRINVPASAQKQQQNMRFYEVLTKVIYFHFKNIAQSNKLACQLWVSIKNQINALKNNKQLNQNVSMKAPQLKVATLNLLTIKQLIPTSESINLIDFKEVLEKLKKSKFVVEKQHIQELLEVYGEPDKNSSIQKKQQPTANLNKKPEKLKQQANDQPQWLKKVKENPIAKKLTDRLGGKFCKNQDRKNKIQQQIAAQVANGLLTQKLSDYGFDDDIPIKVIRTSKLLKAYEQKMKQVEQQQKKQKQQQDNNKKQQAQQQNKKKKKKKNKKKKTKTINSQQQKQKQLQIQNKIQKQKQINKQMNQEQIKQYSQTIKFLAQMKIDESKRQACKFDKYKIQDWRKNLNFINGNR